MQAIDRRSPSLREIQTRMISLILDPHAAEDANIDAWIAEPAHGRQQERIAVYVDGYPARVREALDESYPAVTHLIGPGALCALTVRYIAALSHHSYNLNDVGRELPEFLAGDTLSAVFPFLPDLARLEWAITRAFHAHERSPLDRSRVATVTASRWLNAAVEFQPAVAVLRSAWPIRTLWSARELPLQEIDIEVQGRAECVLVRRAGATVHCDAIEDTEAAVLKALLAGRLLGDLGEILATEDGDYADVTKWFARWMEQGLIVDCDFPPRLRRGRA